MKNFPGNSLVGDTGELIDQLEAHRTVHEIRNTSVLCVGEPNDFCEGKTASRRAQNRFGLSIDYLSFERFKQRLESVDPADEDVLAIRDQFLEQASAVTSDIGESIAPGSARASKLLEGMIEEDEYDALAVNCLSVILNMVETTPCVASCACGIVACRRSVRRRFHKR